MSGGGAEATTAGTDGSKLQQQLTANASSPFDEPLQRTRWLVRYIRLKKRRAEDELARQNELKRRKKDARATVQSALGSLKSSEEEVKRCEQKMVELNDERHRIVGSLKEVLGREEEEKKRQREAEESLRAKFEAEQRLQQQQAAALEMAALQSQVKNAQFLSVLNAMLGVGEQTSQQQQVNVNTSQSAASIAAALAPHLFPGAGGLMGGHGGQHQQTQHQQIQVGGSRVFKFVRTFIRTKFRKDFL